MPQRLVFLRESARPLRAAPQKLLPISPFVLEVEFQRKLHQPRVAYTERLPKCGVAQIAIRAGELRVVPDVEYVAAEFHPQFFRERSLFRKAQVCIVDSRPAAECTRRVPDRAVSHSSGIGARTSARIIWIIVEKGRVEHITINPWIVGLERSGQIRLPGRLEVKLAVQELVVCLRRYADREAALQAFDAGYFPSIQQLAFEPVKLGNRQVPNEVDYKAMSRVILGQPVGRVEVERIQRIFEAGRIVQGFAPCIRSLELQTMRKTLLKHRLQRIVVGLRDGILGKDAGDWRRT